MRYEWEAPETLTTPKTLCYVEGPLEGFAITRHEASERQMAHEILRLAKEVQELRTRLAPAVGEALWQTINDLAVLRARLEGLKGKIVWHRSDGSILQIDRISPRREPSVSVIRVFVTHSKEKGPGCPGL